MASAARNRNDSPRLPGAARPASLALTEPLYRQIIDDLLILLRSGQYSPGDRLPGERELSERYQVNKNTVVRALQELERRGWIERRRGAGTFAAAGPAERRTGTVGLLVNAIHSPFYGRLIESCEQALAAHGQHLLVCNTLGRFELEQRQAEALLREEKVDGLIVCSVDLDRNRQEAGFLNRLALEDCPLVVLLPQKPLPEVPCLTVDFADAAWQATRHLLALGHRRIGLVLTERREEQTIRERRLGYERALREAGLAPDPELILHIRGAVEEFGRDAADQAVALASPATAFLAVNDEVAIGMMRRLRQLGREIPEDLALVGIDDSQWSDREDLRLSTVALPYAELARLAIERVLRGQKPVSGNIVADPLRGRLIVRESCGAAVRQPEK